MVWSVLLIALIIFVCSWICYKGFFALKPIWGLRKDLMEARNPSGPVPAAGGTMTEEGRKRTPGVTVFGIWAIIVSLLVFFTYFDKLGRFMSVGVFTKLQIITIPLWLIFGIGVLMRRSWARIGLIALSVYNFVVVFYPFKYFRDAVMNIKVPELTMIAASLAFFGYTAYYFMRPAVKSQFK